MGATLLLPDAVVLDHGLACGQGVLVRDGIVVDVVAADAGHGAEVRRVPGTLLPGAIDLQVNGCRGRSVDEGTHEALQAIAEGVWDGGAVAFLPTLVTAPWDQLLDQVAAVAAWIAARPADAPGATPLGLHVEGPFLEEPGAHDEQLFLDPAPARLRALQEAAQGQLALVTLAPGRAGAAAATAHLVDAGVAVALGHGTSLDEFDGCVAAGASLVTHLFNAMGPLHHRSPGLAGRALDTERLSCPLILDGEHVDPAVVRLAWRCLGARRTVLVTDAMPAAGLSDGSYSFGCIDATVRNGIARDANGNLAGSMLTMAEAIRNLLHFVPDAGPWSAAQCAATNPARLLHRTDLGSIRPGHRARFTLLHPHSITAC